MNNTFKQLDFNYTTRRIDKALQVGLKYNIMSTKFKRQKVMIFFPQLHNYFSIYFVNVDEEEKQHIILLLHYCSRKQYYYNARTAL